MRDEVTVEVWDGASLGTGCIPRVDFRTASVRPGCHGLRLHLGVQVGDFASNFGAVEKVPLPGGVFAALLLIPIFIYVAMRWRRARSDRREIAHLRESAARLLGSEFWRKRGGPNVLSLFCRSCDPEIGRERRSSSSLSGTFSRWCCTFKNYCVRPCTPLCCGDTSQTAHDDGTPLTDDEHAAALDAIKKLNELYPCMQSAKGFEELRETGQMKGAPCL